MGRLKNIIIALFLLIVVLTVLGCSEESGGEQAPQAPIPGNTAPDFHLKSLDGETVKLDELRGRPVLLNFWATWCGPCRHEMPFLQEVSEDKEWNKRGLTILAVNLREPAPAVQEFMDAYGLSFTVLLDSGGRVGMLYNAAAIPTTYLIDNNGIIRNIQKGAFVERAHIDWFLVNSLMEVES